MPDGTRCYYDTSGRLVEIIDPFGAGATLDWSDPGLHVVQYLGNGQSREVVIGVSFSGWTSMTYEGRTWTYEYPAGRLTAVTPPLGPSWSFSYNSDGSLAQVVTPYGGQTTYTYALHQFARDQDAGNPQVQVFSNVVTTKTADDRVGNAGTWNFTYQNGEPTPAGSCSGDCTIVETPSHVLIVYDYGLVLYSPLLGGGYVLNSRRVVDHLGGAVVETESRQYVANMVSTASGKMTPEITSRTVQRDGATYSSQYQYAGANFDDYHRPYQIIEAGPGLSRTTTHTFDYGFQSNIIGKVSGETVTVNGESATKSWTYDHTTGFTLSETDYGITTNFRPDGVGNVYQSTDMNGHATTFGYQWGVVSGIWKPETAVVRTVNPEGTIASETQGSRTTNFSYDDLFRIVQTSPPDANSIVTAYNDAGAQVTVYRGASQTTATVDGFGRVIHTVNSVGINTDTGYDIEGRKTYESLPFTGTSLGTHTAYDALGRVVSRTNADRSAMTLTYGAGGTVAIRDENGRTTTQTWNAFGDPDDHRLATVLDANGQTWTYSYNALGKLTHVSGPPGPNGDSVDRSWQYDSGSPLLRSETQPESGTTTYGYDPAGNVKTKTDANGTAFTFTYDGNNRLTTIVAGGRPTTITYEPGSDNRQTATAPFVDSSFVYDPAGRLEHRRDIVDGRRFAADFAYDGNDNLTDITYTSGRHVHQDFDAENRLGHVVDATTGAEYATNVGYHASGAIATYHSGNGIVHTMTYDPNRYWLRSINAGDLHLSYDNYDLVGNVGTIGDSRSGMTQTFAYDALDRLATATGPYGVQSFAYDGHGDRLNAGGSTYQYQSGTMRLVGQNGSAFGYDGNGNLRTGPNATYNYTPDNLLETASLSGGVLATYAYDADQWRTKKVVGSDVSYFSRGAGGELLTDWANPGGASPSIKDYVYAGGRLLAEAERAAAIGSTPPDPALPGAPSVPSAPGPVGSPGLTPPVVDGTPPPPPPPPTGGPNVVFHENAAFGGASFSTATDITFVGSDWNDRITSVEVPAGTIVVLFQDSNYNGARLVLTSNVSDLAMYPGPGPDGSWNDVVSSVRILPAGSQLPPIQGGNVLGPDNGLHGNDTITSSNGEFTLIYQQSDGNLVLYNSAGDPIVEQQDGRHVCECRIHASRRQLRHRGRRRHSSLVDRYRGELRRLSGCAGRWERRAIRHDGRTTLAGVSD